MVFDFSNFFFFNSSHKLANSASKLAVMSVTTKVKPSNDFSVNVTSIPTAVVLVINLFFVFLKQLLICVLYLCSYNLILPINTSLNITQSPIRLYIGYTKVAGLFFSNIKCPIQAKP